MSKKELKDFYKEHENEINDVRALFNNDVEIGIFKASPSSKLLYSIHVGDPVIYSFCFSKEFTKIIKFCDNGSTVVVSNSDCKTAFNMVKNL